MRTGTLSMRMGVGVVAAVLVSGESPPLPGQSLENGAEVRPERTRAAAPLLRAQRLTGTPPTIDGVLDEPDWALAAVARDFIVFGPDEGEPPSEKTEARVLYGDRALYVGIRAFDSSPDSIVAQLEGRDDRPHADRVEVVIDSYRERRTALGFGVTPAGVKSDGYLYDDANQDDSWDAVWDAATRIDREGWTAEFRIPYSELRFDGAASQTWGINFTRFIARHMERSLWAPISGGDGAILSRLGDLEGPRDLSPRTRVEAPPHSRVRMKAAPESRTDRGGEMLRIETPPGGAGSDSGGHRWGRGCGVVPRAGLQHSAGVQAGFGSLRPQVAGA